MVDGEVKQTNQSAAYLKEWDNGQKELEVHLVDKGCKNQSGVAYLKERDSGQKELEYNRLSASPPRSYNLECKFGGRGTLIKRNNTQ